MTLSRRPSLWQGILTLMTARHILTYAQSLDGGGVERAMLRLARAWIAAGRRVSLVIGDAEGPLARELPPEIDLIATGGRGMAAMLALPAIVRRQAPDILFCAGNHYTALALWTRLRLGSGCPPIVAKMSNSPARADHGAILDAGHRLWLSRHGRFLDHLVAMTPETALAAARATAMVGRTSVIANPPAMPVPGAALPALPAGPFVLGVGRLEPQKRWDRLVAAIPALPPGVAVVIVGEGSRRTALADQARALGVADRLLLPGYAADPLAVMARAAVVVLTSDFEGVPGVLREALSVGTPVVTTRSSDAVAEIVGGPHLGTIVARDDGAALAAAIRRWLAAPRPAPVPQPGAGSAARYLGLFDSLV